MSQIICFGEVLWDLLPTGKKLGGAPLNVTFRLTEFKQDALLVSAIGTDDLGEQIKTQISQLGINATLKRHSQLRTGVVLVDLQPDGSAKYSIEHPVAWDEIPTKLLKSNVVVFGSLALRSEYNKSELNTLITKANLVFFDVNLRAPFFSFELIEAYICKSDLIKFNNEEFEWYCKMNNWDADLDTAITAFQQKFPNKSLCITLGAAGAIWLVSGEVYTASAPKIKVQDTIGAGDAFFACLITGIQLQKSHQEILEFACKVGAIVATQKGATTALSTTIIDEFNKIKSL
jgi:fructokinase